MHLYGKVIVIKRNGADGAHFPLTARCCVFGRGFDSDIRIQLPTVDTSQCQILIDDKEHVFIQSMSTSSSTLINDKTLSEALTALSHGDIITIVDRKFRFEFPSDSKFYPHKSPKSKSPRTPKRASMARLSAGGEKDSSFSKRLTPVTPLSPRTDNVPESIKSPRSVSKVSGQPVAAVNDDQFSSPKAGRQSYGSAKKASSPESLFGMSPAAFYPASLTPGSSKDFIVSSSISPEGPVNQTSQKSPAAARQKNPGSPYSKTPGSLRKTISDLRRRSVPVFETEEGPAQVQTKVRTQGFATPSVQVGNKRKSTTFDFLSAKRKRVSFGPNLSPEHFDKTLPPKTPIKKGATPSRIIKQERKSLLKAKSPGRKSLSPRTKSPFKVVSTPPSSQVFEVSINTEDFSPAIASPDRSKLQSPKSGLNESDSRRSPRGGSENETSAVSSPGRKLSPANKRDFQTFVKLEEDNASVIEYLTQEKLLNHALTSSGSALGVLPPNTKLEKGGSPLSSGNSSFASSPKSPQRSSPISSTEKRRSVGRPPSRSSPSFQISATPRRSLSVSSAEKRSVGRPPSRSKSDPSFRKSASPRGSFSVSSAEKRSVGRPPSRSSLSFQSSATPGRNFSVSSAEKRSVGRPPSRSISDSSFRKSVTPVKSYSPLGTSLSVRASLSPKNTSLNTSGSSVLLNDSLFQKSVSPRGSVSVSSAEKRPVGRPPSSSNLSFQSSATPGRSFSVSSAEKRSVGRPPSRSKSDSSFRKSVTPAKSYSSLETSLSVKASLSPKNTPVNTSGGDVSPNVNTSAKARKLSTSPMLSQDLFSQVSPKAVAGRTTPSQGQTSLAFKRTEIYSTTEVLSPVGIKRIFKTPKHQQAANISPAAMRRIMKTPKVKHIPVSPISPIGLRNLVKTPRNRKSNQVVGSPSGFKPLVKTPGVKKVPEGSLVGVNETMTPPRAESSNVSFSGVSALFSTPDISTHSAASVSLNNGDKSVPKKPLSNTPESSLSKRYSQTPKRFLETPVLVSAAEKKRSVGRPLSEKKPPAESPSSEKRLVGQPLSEKRLVGRPASEKRPVGRPPSEKRPVGRPASEKRPAGRPPSAKKTPATKNSPAEKIISPPQDFKKVVALRAIHGHGLTPKRATFKAQTPTSTKKASGVFRKTPGKKTWSDIVKSGVQKPAPAKIVGLTAIKPATQRISPKLNKKIHKTPKTPRALARALAPTTGHADSPATIIVGRKFKAARTPKLLPRKGRKVSLSKASRKSVGNTSFTGLTEMFTEPVVNESTLYADIPDTPNGPNEMFVSPLSNGKSSLSGRKSTNLIGVRELFLKKHSQETNYVGVKELFTSSGASSPVSPSGVGRLMKTPKKRAVSVSPTGVKRLLKTPKIKGIPISPVGVDNLFKTPTLSGDAAVNDGKSTVNQVTKSGKAISPVVSTKSGQRGRKRKSEEPLATPSSKKSALTQLTADLTPKSSHKEHQEESLKNKVESVRKTSSGKSPSPSGKRQSGVQKAVVQSRGSPAAVSPVGAHGRKYQAEIRQSSVNIERVTMADGDQYILSPPKGGPKGKRGKAAIVETTSAVVDVDVQSPPKVGALGRLGQAAIKKSAVNIKTADADKQILSPPKAGSRGRQGKVQIKETVSLDDVLSPPKVGARGRQGKAQIKETVSLADALSPPKVGARGRQGKAQIKETVSLADALSPPKVGARGRQGKAQIKETVSLADALSPPKVGARGRQGKAQIKETVSLADALSPPKVGARGRRGKAQIQETVSLADVLSPPKVGARGRRGPAENKESTVNIKTGKVSVAAKHIVSPTKDGPRGRQNKAQIKESAETGSTGRSQGRKETVQAQEITTPAFVETAEPVSKGRRGRGQIKEPVHVQSGASLNDDVETAGKNVRQSKTSVAVVEKTLSPKVAKRGGRGKSKSTETASIEDISAVASDVKATSSKAVNRGRLGKVPVKASVLPSDGKESQPATRTTASTRQGEAQIVETSLDNTSTVARRGGKRGEAAIVPQVTEAATKSPNKRRGGRRDALSPVAESVLPGKSSRRGAKPSVAPGSPVSSNDVPQEGKQIGEKRKAGKSTAVPAKKVKLESPVPVTPVKPRATRKGLNAGAKSPKINTASSPKGRGRSKKGAEVVSVPATVASPIPSSPPKGRKGQLKKAAEAVILAPLSTGKRGRPKKNYVATEIIDVLATPSSGKQGTPKKNTAAVETVAPPSTGKRGRPKKNAAKAVDIVASPPGKRGRSKKNALVVPSSPAKGRKGQIKKPAEAETVDIVASPPRKQSRAKKNDSVVPSSPARGRKGQLKNAAAAETVEIIAPPSTGKRGRPKKNAAVKIAASLPKIIAPTPKSSPLKGRQGRLKKAATVETVASPATKKRGGGAKASLTVSGSKGKSKSAGAIPHAAKSAVATRRRRL